MVDSGLSGGECQKGLDPTSPTQGDTAGYQRDTSGIPAGYQRDTAGYRGIPGDTGGYRAPLARSKGRPWEASRGPQPPPTEALQRPFRGFLEAF